MSLSIISYFYQTLAAVILPPALSLALKIHPETFPNDNLLMLYTQLYTYALLMSAPGILYLFLFVCTSWYQMQEEETKPERTPSVLHYSQKQ